MFECTRCTRTHTVHTHTVHTHTRCTRTHTRCTRTHTRCTHIIYRIRFLFNPMMLTICIIVGLSTNLILKNVRVHTVHTHTHTHSLTHSLTLLGVSILLAVEARRSNHTSRIRCCECVVGWGGFGLPPSAHVVTSWSLTGSLRRNVGAVVPLAFSNA